MKVKYLNYRIRGEDMTGRVVDKDDAEAKVLIESNIVVPVEIDVVETATIQPSENKMRNPNIKKKITK